MDKQVTCTTEWQLRHEGYGKQYVTTIYGRYAPLALDVFISS